ncbi:MAG: tetratricopeptide repeat protein [Bacteroidetes bacterium]|nr:MAG: tetratricopeptide repeat protein [Bacteroidota bacterium]
MKRALLSILCLLLLTLPAARNLSAQLPPDSAFRAANRLYEEGAFEEALNRYREIVAGGYESPDLYYNMGNAAFRSNNIGYAVLYFEKALKLDPSHRDALHNLEFVSRYRVDTFEEVPQFFLRTWTRSLVTAFSERSWSILSLVFFILILGSFLVYLFSKKPGAKKAGFAGFLAFLLFFAVSMGAAVAQYGRITTPEAGIILSPSVVVRSSPSGSGTELFILHEGTRVLVNEEVSGWQNIRVTDGREGWIPVTDFNYI